jgi:hypothetical protein
MWEGIAEMRLRIFPCKLKLKLLPTRADAIVGF